MAVMRQNVGFEDAEGHNCLHADFANKFLGGGVLSPAHRLCAGDTYIHMYIHIYTYMYIYVHVHIYVNMHIGVYIYVY